MATLAKKVAFRHQSVSINGPQFTRRQLQMTLQGPRTNVISSVTIRLYLQEHLRAKFLKQMKAEQNDCKENLDH